MALKTNWMDQYFVAVRKNVLLYQTSSGSAGDDVSASVGNTGTLTSGNGSSAGGGDKLFTTDTTVYGIGDATDTKKFQLPLNNHPDFVPGQDIVNTRKTIGSPLATGGDGYEITRGGISPTASLEFDVDTRTIVPFLWALFHDGSSESIVDFANGSEELTNGTMEAFTGGLADGWTESNDPTTSEESVIFQGGAGSQQIDVDAADEGIYQTITVDPTRGYVLDGYVYGDATNDIVVEAVDGAGVSGTVLYTQTFSAAAASWTRVTSDTIVYPTSTQMTIVIKSGTAATYTFYADTFSVVDANLYSHLQFEPSKLDSASKEPAAAEAFMSLFRRMSYDSANSMLLTDAIVSGMTLSATEGEPLRCTTDVVGRFLVTDFDHDNLNSALVEGFPEQQPLMWNDATVTLEDVDDANGDHYVMPASSFSLTITPTVSVKRYDSRWPVRYVISDWSISGSISFPWTSIGDSVGNTDKNYLLNRLVRDDSAAQNNITPMELYVTWFGDPNVSLALGGNLDGTSGSTVDDIRNFASSDTIGGGNHHHGDFGIFMGISPTNIETGGEDETMVTMTFDCVDIRASNSVTQQALEIFILDKRNYGIDNLSGTPEPKLITNHA